MIYGLTRHVCVYIVGLLIPLFCCSLPIEYGAASYTSSHGKRGCWSNKWSNRVLHLVTFIKFISPVSLGKKRTERNLQLDTMKPKWKLMAEVRFIKKWINVLIKKKISCFNWAVVSWLMKLVRMRCYQEKAPNPIKLRAPNYSGKSVLRFRCDWSYSRDRHIKAH